MSPCFAHPICAKTVHMWQPCACWAMKAVQPCNMLLSKLNGLGSAAMGSIQSSLLSCSARCIAKPAQVPSLACLPDGTNLQGSQQTLLQQGTSAPLPCLPWQQHCTGPATARLAVSAEIGDITYENIGYKYQVVHHKLFQLSSCLLGPS